MNLEMDPQFRTAPAPKPDTGGEAKKPFEMFEKFDKEDMVVGGDLGNVAKEQAAEQKEERRVKQEAAIARLTADTQKIFDDIGNGEEKEWNTGGGKWKPL